MTKWVDVEHDPNAIRVLDHGFVVLIDIMGNDSAIANAARTSYGSGTKKTSDDRALIRHLIRNQHTSPIEMVELKFLLKMPIFIARQHVRHRTASINEYSGRYSVMSDEFYLPDISRFQKQHETNKQASGEMTELYIANNIRDSLIDSYNTTYKNYEYALDEGLSRELARIQLPVANYTEMYWKIDLKNFFNYIKLRMDKQHAQFEIVQYAEAMYTLVKPLLPLSCEAFEDYWFNAKSFSKQELDILGSLLRNEISLTETITSNLLSKNELNDFIRKLTEIYNGNTTVR